MNVVYRINDPGVSYNITHSSEANEKFLNVMRHMSISRYKIRLERETFYDVVKFLFYLISPSQSNVRRIKSFRVGWFKYWTNSSRFSIRYTCANSAREQILTQFSGYKFSRCGRSRHTPIHSAKIIGKDYYFSTILFHFASSATKVFVAVAVIAALCAVLITADSDEEKEGYKKEIEGRIEIINTRSADLAKLKITWVEEVNKNLSSLQSSSLQKIGKTFHQTFWNITLTAEGKQAASCVESALSSIMKYLPDAAAALNKTRDTALDSTYTQDRIEDIIAYGRILIRSLNWLLVNLDCLVYQPNASNFCIVMKETYTEYDRDIRYYYDKIDGVNKLIEEDTANAYSTASEANAKTVETAREKARSVEDTAAECIASL